MDEELQLQTILVPRDVLSDAQRSQAASGQREELERYVGIQHNFPDPYHIYLHVDDITMNGGQLPPVIRFIIYSMGKKKVILAGTYRRYLQNQSPRSPFNISHACRYNTRDLMTFIDEWGDKFVNTLNIMKNRINTRVSKFLGTSPVPYLKDREDYIQLKAWLALQPMSAYSQPDKNTIRIQSLITPDYERRLRESFKEFNIIRNLERQKSLAYLADDTDTVFDLDEDIDRLLSSIIEKLDGSLNDYEREMNIESVQVRNKEIIEISKRFVQWLQTSQFTSDQWVKSLQECQCINESDEGCRILEWGSDAYNNFT